MEGENIVTVKEATKMVKACREKIHKNSHLDDLGMNQNQFLSPSNDWTWIKSVGKIGKKEREEILHADFFTRSKELIGLDEVGPIGGDNKVGMEWDKIMENFIKKKDEKPEDKKIAESLLKALKHLFKKLTLLDSQFPLNGYMKNPEDAMIYFWNGKADAIAWYEGKYVIVDWKAVDLNPPYWDSKYGCGAHLHQCLVYAKLLQLHLELPYLPYILIVPISRITGKDISPGLFKDYHKCCKDKLDEFEWSVERPEHSKVVYQEENVFKKTSNEITESTLLRDLFKSEATVKDLQDIFGLPKLVFKKNNQEAEIEHEPPRLDKKIKKKK